MSQTPDYYDVLGVKPSATAAEIKHAYRAQAKRAHPDAGGSLQAMERVNEAYHELSDPVRRRDYDRARSQPKSEAEPEPVYRSEPEPRPATHASTTTHRASTRRHYESEEDEVRKAWANHRTRLRQARANALQILRTSALWAVMLSIIAFFITTQSADFQTRLLFIMLSFVPVYGVVLGIIFLINPQWRLDVFDLMHGPRGHLTQGDKITILALALMALPLAAVWYFFITSLGTVSFAF